MERIIIDILGWAGTILYLIAYGLISAKKVEGDSWWYQGLNIVAGIFLIINTFYLRAYPSAGMNIAWVGIAFLTVLMTLIVASKIVDGVIGLVNISLIPSC